MQHKHKEARWNDGIVFCLCGEEMGGYAQDPELECLKCGYKSRVAKNFYGVVNDQCVLCEKCWDEEMWGTGDGQDKNWQNMSERISLV